MTPREIYQICYRLERKRLSNTWHTVTLENKQAWTYKHPEIAFAAERSLDMRRWSRLTGYRYPRGHRACMIVRGLSRWKADHFPQPAEPDEIPF